MVTISLRIPESLAAEVAAAARRNGVSEAALMRDALEAFLDPGEASHARSALDLARDLVGICEGPKDLSTNAEYMEGFGE